MILCDHQIEQALKTGQLKLDPMPESGQYNSSSLDLRVGDDFLIWNDALRAKGTAHSIDLDHVDISNLVGLTTCLNPDASGIVTIPPGEFVLVRTLEYVTLPFESKLAARIEGRSRQARLGMGVHITAPTIHAGFSGKITLEIVNHGPFELKVRPNVSKLAQLIIEKVAAIPSRRTDSTFSSQTTTLGTPPRKPK